MKLGIPKEVRPGERRVAGTPETVSRLIKLGFDVQVQAGAGAGAAIPDDDYVKVGASIVADVRELWTQSDVVLKVQPPEQHTELGLHETELLREGSTLICFLWPASQRPE